MEIQFQVRADLSLGKDSFGVRLDQNRLVIPEALHQKLIQLGLRSPFEFIAFLRSFPEALGEVLGWDKATVFVARTELFEHELRGRVPDEWLSNRPPPRFAYGALDPKKYPRK